ncbi:MAG TPA: hypothetical protein VGR14_06370 [Verrucomicrobiae bacterium]|jgi:hypothetical protein|nr:hypothetical protein [Verrucomicrobiae bacterium]
MVVGGSHKRIVAQFAVEATKLRADGMRPAFEEALKISETILEINDLRKWFLNSQQLEGNRE